MQCRDDELALELEKEEPELCPFTLEPSEFPEF
jgi:hypothetical protein